MTAIDGQIRCPECEKNLGIGRGPILTKDDKPMVPRWTCPNHQCNRSFTEDQLQRLVGNMTNKVLDENVEEACDELRRAAALVDNKYGDCEIEICFVAEDCTDDQAGMVTKRQTGEITINVKRS